MTSFWGKAPDRIPGDSEAIWQNPRPEVTSAASPTCTLGGPDTEVGNNGLSSAHSVPAWSWRQFWVKCQCGLNIVHRQRKSGQDRSRQELWQTLSPQPRWALPHHRDLKSICILVSVAVLSTLVKCGKPCRYLSVGEGVTKHATHRKGIPKLSIHFTRQNNQTPKNKMCHSLNKGRELGNPQYTSSHKITRP